MALGIFTYVHITSTIFFLCTSQSANEMQRIFSGIRNGYPGTVLRSCFLFVRKCNVKPFICNKLLFDFIVQQQNFVEWGENNEKRQVYTLMRNACLALVL